MHYLITGHTGFKGSWLALMLHMQGHAVSGIALDPLEKSLFNQAELNSIFEHDLRIDIRNREAIQTTIARINPEIIIHLAAQPLVRESYRIPLETFDTNVLGTLNVLHATRDLSELKAALIITTDKVYKNHNHLRGYIETDELGGDDPYSASKAAADIAAQSWIKSFARVPIAIARAGNVIGGGDWAADRIIPDLVQAYTNNRKPILRYPDAIRPWQHVLDCLNGYQALVEKSINSRVAGEWNFGPDALERKTVGDLVSLVAPQFEVEAPFWELERLDQPHEAGLLLLDSSKSRNMLGWKEKLDFVKTVSWTCEWYKSTQDSNAREISEEQIRRFNEIRV